MTLAQHLGEYLNRGDAAAKIAMMIAHRLELPVSMFKVAAHLTGLRVWSYCYQWRYLHPTVSDKDIARELHAAVKTVRIDGEGPGPSLLKFLTEAQQESGERLVDTAVLKSTAWEIPSGNSSVHVQDQLSTLLGSSVMFLDEALKKACPGPRVSLKDTSPVRAAALYLAFTQMYGVDPKGGDPVIELVAHQFFEEIGDRLSVPAIFMGSQPMGPPAPNPNPIPKSQTSKHIAGCFLALSILAVFVVLGVQFKGLTQDIPQAQKLVDSQVSSKLQSHKAKARLSKAKVALREAKTKAAKDTARRELVDAAFAVSDYESALPHLKVLAKDHPSEPTFKSMLQIAQKSRAKK